MQNYTEIASSTLIKDSLTPLLNNFKTIMSLHSGSSFPTTNLQLGMLCYRTDEQKTYILTQVSPAIWKLELDFSQSVGAAGALLSSTFVPFFTNGSERMRLDANGDFGVGTNAPNGARLSVVGANPASNATRNLIRFADASGKAGSISVTGSAYSYAGAGANELWYYANGGYSAVTYGTDGGIPLKFITNLAERMRIDPNGNLLVGMNSSVGRLTVRNASTADQSISGYFSASDANLNGFAVRHLPSTNTVLLSSEWSNNAVALALGTGGSEYMRVANNGNVSIGTSSGSSKLTVSTGNGFGHFGGANSAEDGASPFIGSFNNASASAATFGWGFYDSNVTGNLAIYRRNLSTTGVKTFELNRSNGCMTIPSQPSFEAGIASGSDATVGSGGFIPFNTFRSNTGNHFNASTNKFTAPVAGLYVFAFGVYFTNSGGNTQSMQAALNVNGTNPGIPGGDAYGVSAVTPNSAGGIMMLSTTVPIRLSAGDVVGVSNRAPLGLRIYQGHSYFSGYLVG